MIWRNVLMGLFGAWFASSPWTFNPQHSNAYDWTAVFLGGLVFLGSIWALFGHRHHAWRYGVEAVFGTYLGLTPFFYGFTGHPWALWITMVIGAATLTGGLWNAFSDHGTQEHLTHSNKRVA